MWCPWCKQEAICSVIPGFPDDRHSNPRAQNKFEEGLNWFERKRHCHTCDCESDTAEIDHDQVVELWKLRYSMCKIATEAGKLQEACGLLKAEAEALRKWQDS